MALAAIAIGLQVATPLIGGLFQMIGNKKTNDKVKELAQQQGAATDAVVQQFARSTGLSSNIHAATGTPQGVPGGQFPQGYA
jgi:methylphosphotriester-DNA--protein-cysteine methyltransferase